MSEDASFPKPTLTVTHFSSKGRGVGLLPRKDPAPPLKVDVLSGLPQDELEVLLGKKRRGACSATIQKIVTPSPFRVEPRCAHVPSCGGCSWQQMGYPFQLKEKEAIVKKAFLPLGDKEVVFHPIIPCSSFWHYRNKMEFSFSQNRKGERFLGLILAGTKGHVFTLSECPISPSWFANTLSAVKKWWDNSSLDAYRLSDEGTLRTLILREGKRTQDKMAMLTVSGNPKYAPSKTEIDSFVETIKNATDGKISIFLRIQQTAKGFPTQFFEMQLFGPDHIKEILHLDTGYKKHSLVFKISPTSFFQPNTEQAEILYSKALQMVKLPPDAHVLDLYCGTGTLSMAFALIAKKVTGIELNPHAIFDAKSNSEENGFTNIDFHCGDAAKTLADLMAKKDFISPDLVVVDPPRTGLDQNALRHLLTLLPEQILYISCNPKTQAENILALQETHYQLVELQPIDQFPHTVHIENIALLKKRVFP